MPSVTLRGGSFSCLVTAEISHHSFLTVLMVGPRIGTSWKDRKYSWLRVDRNWRREIQEVVGARSSSPRKYPSDHFLKLAGPTSCTTSQEPSLRSGALIDISATDHST